MEIFAHTYHAVFDVIKMKESKIAHKLIACTLCVYPGQLPSYAQAMQSSSVFDKFQCVQHRYCNTIITNMSAFRLQIFSLGGTKPRSLHETHLLHIRQQLFVDFYLIIINSSCNNNISLYEYFHTDNIKSIKGLQ